MNPAASALLSAVRNTAAEARDFARHLDQFADAFEDTHLGPNPSCTPTPQALADYRDLTAALGPKRQSLEQLNATISRILLTHFPIQS